MEDGAGQGKEEQVRTGNSCLFLGELLLEDIRVMRKSICLASIVNPRDQQYS